MENIGADFLGDIWGNGRQNVNFEVEIEEDDGAGLDAEADAEGILDGGVAGASEGSACKRRSAECDLVSEANKV